MDIAIAAIGFSAQVILAQIVQRLQNGLRFAFGIEEAGVWELMGIGVGTVDPVNAADRGFADGDRREFGGPLGLAFGAERAPPVPGFGGRGACRRIAQC